MAIDTSRYGYPLNTEFNRDELRELLNAFRGAVNREQDKGLANHLEEQILHRTPPAIDRITFYRLAKWCNTNGHIYWDGMEIARKISLLLFGAIVDRQQLGV